MRQIFRDSVIRVKRIFKPKENDFAIKITILGLVTTRWSILGSGSLEPFISKWWSVGGYVKWLSLHPFQIRSLVVSIWLRAIFGISWSRVGSQWYLGRAFSQWLHQNIDQVTDIMGPGFRATQTQGRRLIKAIPKRAILGSNKKIGIAKPRGEFCTSQSI